MQLLQFLYGRTQTLLHQILIEEICQALFLLCLSIGIYHPRCLVEYQILQLLVLFKGTGQRVLISLLLPKGEHLLGVWILSEDITTQTVGIERGSLRDGIIITRTTYHWQGLNHQPSGIIGVFECQFTILAIGWNQLRQVDRLCTCMVLGDRYCYRHALRTWQDRQIMLFTIREVVATDAHLTDE